MAAPNVSQVVVVPDRPADVLPHILAVVGTDGYQLAARPDAGVVLSRRRIPVWAIVLAVVLFPFGLLFLLVRQDEIVNVSVHHVSGGTQVTIAGRASVRLQNAIQYAVGSYPGAGAGTGSPVVPGYSGAPGRAAAWLPPPPPPGSGSAPPPPPAPMSPREALAIQEAAAVARIGRGSQAEARPAAAVPAMPLPGAPAGAPPQAFQPPPAPPGPPMGRMPGGGPPGGLGPMPLGPIGAPPGGGMPIGPVGARPGGAFGLGPLPSLGGPPGGGSVAPGGIEPPPPEDAP